MKSGSKYVIVILLLEFILALGIRTYSLDARPMHTDEAVQAIKFGQLLETGQYEYDPRHFHGPTLYYLALPVAWFRGQENLQQIDEITVRLVSAFFGSALILSLFWLRDGLGPVGTILTGAFFTFSPAMVYYSRYYIQEPLLIIFTSCALACGWRCYQNPKITWAVAAGISVGLLHATKESSLISLVGFAVSLTVCGITARRTQKVGGSIFKNSNIRQAIRLGLSALSAAALISAVFYSSFFTNLSGIGDAIISPFVYSLESGHEKPFYYYIGLLSGLEGGLGILAGEGAVVIFALVAAIISVREKWIMTPTRKLRRFLAFFTLILLFIYSLLSYKTPWLVLSLLLGLALMAGSGLQALYDRCRKPAPCLGITALLLIVLGFLLRGAYLTNFRYYADARNPYAYVHPNTDVLKIGERIKRLAELSPLGRKLPIKVISEEYWPLPWYLRQFENVGYWNDMPDAPDASVIIVSAKLQDILEAKISPKYQIEYRGLRPGVVLLIYIEEKLWSRFMEEIDGN